MKVCVIGCGAVARRMHIPVFQSLSDVEVVSVVDSYEQLAKDVSKEFGISKYYTDYKKALSETDVDIVSVCTPSFTHAEIISDVAKLGKHILAEKPLTLDLDEGKKVLEVVKDNGVQLGVVFNYRSVDVAQQVHETLQKKQLSRIVSMVGVAHTPCPSSWTSGRWLYHEGGALDDFGPHLIDMLLWLNPSTLESVSAQGGDFTGGFNFISHIQVSMQFKDTSLALADISWLNDSFLFNFDIHGTAGRIVCDVRNGRWYKTHGQVSSPLTEMNRTFKDATKMITSIASGKYFRGGLTYHSRNISGFIDAIKNNGVPPVTGDEALMVTAVSAAAKQSLKTHKTVYIDELLKN
ncbi:MAG: Gfo/Idh/MocA family oxidoreductase [Nitrososphaerota archaeon]|jgi:predicted dehydrogenase|nr:Gfo/Idh/MocA family oxidoreductase [Nitrososphaerota archaeon]